MENGQTKLFYLGRISTQDQWGPLTKQSLIDQLTPIQLDLLGDYQAWQEGWENWRPVLEVEEIKSTLPQLLKKPEHQQPPPKLSIPKPPPLPTVGKNVGTESNSAAIKSTNKKGAHQRTSPTASHPEANNATASHSKTGHSTDSHSISNDSTSIHTQIESSSATVDSHPHSSKASDGKDSRKFHRYNVRLRVIMRSEEVTFRTFTRNISAGGVALEHSVPDDLLGSSVKMYISDPETEANIRFHVQVVPNRDETKFFFFTGLSEQESTKFASWLGKFFTSLSQAS